MNAPALALHLPADPDLHQAPVLPRHLFRYGKEHFHDLELSPYSPIVGAVVRGFRYRKGQTSPELRHYLYQSLLKYGFLSFEPGSIDTDEFHDFVQLFGKPKFAGNPQAPRVAGSEANAIDSSRKQTRTNYIWHIDQAYRVQPQRFTALYAVQAPEFGGGTLFSDTTAAYQLLPAQLAAFFDTLTVIHNADQMGLVSMSYGTPEELAQARVDTPPIEAPLVRVHPETGRKQLFACELYTQRILGLPRVVSDSLLNVVFEYVKAPEVCAEYRWEKGAVLIWDNRTVQHRGIFNYGESTRVLHRAVIQ